MHRFTLQNHEWNMEAWISRGEAMWIVRVRNIRGDAAVKQSEHATYAQALEFALVVLGMKDIR